MSLSMARGKGVKGNMSLIRKAAKALNKIVVVVVLLVVVVVVSKRARIMANELGTSGLSSQKGLMDAPHESRVTSVEPAGI